MHKTIQYIFLAVSFTAGILTSCEKEKISFLADPAPDPAILQSECTDCHEGTFPEHITNAHKKHTDTTGLYAFACSTCHYGHGYGTTTHMNNVKDVTFDPFGLATRNGADTNSPAWNPATKTCTGVYCHSNGRTAFRGTDGTNTWSTTTGPQAATYDTTPNWDFGEINDCVFCHNGKGNMSSPYLVERPNTLTTGNYPASGQHQNGAHMDNDKTFSAAPYNTSPKWDGVQCFWCHSDQATDVASVDGPLRQGTYGTKFHVDGQTYFKPLNISDGGTIANGSTYSSNGTQAHCGNSNKCW